MKTTSHPRDAAKSVKSATIAAALPGGPMGSPDATAVSRRVRYAMKPPCAKWKALSSRSANGSSESPP